MTSPTSGACSPSYGFRAFAYIERRACRLVSRNRCVFRRFDPLRAVLSRQLVAKNAVLDGEIVCLDAEGRSVFRPLLFRRGRPVFAAFDVVWLDGEDLRPRPLVERKARLRALLPIESAHVVHVDHVPERGQELFALACAQDLEGVVGKWMDGSYQSNGRTTSCDLHAGGGARRVLREDATSATAPRPAAKARVTVLSPLACRSFPLR